MTNKALFSVIAILLAGLLSVSAIHTLDNSDTTSVSGHSDHRVDSAGEELNGKRPAL